MTERQAAVAWLEKDYDEELELIKAEIKRDGEPLTYFRAQARWHAGRPMFTIKAQNG